MSRIRKVYASRFRGQLRRLRCRQIERGLNCLLTQADRLQMAQALTAPEALVQIEARLHRALDCYASAVSQRGGPRPDHQPPPQGRSSFSTELRFFCDVGLGGLARWLRAAGYDTLWEAHIEDAPLVRRSLASRRVLLTTDSLLMERRILRTGQLPSFWLPPALNPREQLALAPGKTAVAI